MHTTSLPYRIGLPAWGFSGWKDRYFSSTPSPLANYARVFNAVEGNTTFYAIPSAEIVESWREAVAGLDFEFCFKLPKQVTHQRRADFSELRRFLQAIEPLGDHVGPLMIQFPASVGPAQLDALTTLFSRLPTSYRYAIEVRHIDFYNQPELLLPLIERFQLGRVVVDTRAIFDADRSHPDLAKALHEKPDVPMQCSIHNGILFVRLWLHPDRTSNSERIRQWAQRLNQAITDGHDTYMMVHCPNRQYCPEMAVEIHDSLAMQPGRQELQPLPAFVAPTQGQLI